jgi:hypothetical protein
LLRCPFPGAAAGVRIWPGDALRDPDPHLFFLCLLHKNQLLLLELDLLAPRKGAGVTSYSPSVKSSMSISSVTYKNQFSLQLSSVATKDTAVYYCGEATVRGLQHEHRHKPVCGVLRISRGCLRTSRVFHD